MDHATLTLAVAVAALVVAGSLGRTPGRGVRAPARRGRAGARHPAPTLGLDHDGATARASRSKTCCRGFPRCCRSSRRTGRAEVAVDPVGPDESEVMVKLRPKEEWTTAHDLDDLGDKIKTAVEAEVPATFVSVSQPIEDRVNQLLAGSRADVVIKVFGDDFDHAQGDGRRDRQGGQGRPGPRRLARSTRARPAAARGRPPIGRVWPATGSASVRCWRSSRRPGWGVSPARFSRDRAAST